MCSVGCAVLGPGYVVSIMAGSLVRCPGAILTSGNCQVGGEWGVEGSGGGRGVLWGGRGGGRGALGGGRGQGKYISKGSQ